MRIIEKCTGKLEFKSSNECVKPSVRKTDLIESLPIPKVKSESRSFLRSENSKNLSALPSLFCLVLQKCANFAYHPFFY